eukprot:Skav232615  [mRNA]  locus=scaffold1224:745635:745940:+ [translate_table: standard]
MSSAICDQPILGRSGFERFCRRFGLKITLNLIATAASSSFAMPETMEISDAAKSGDGTTQNVGIKVNASHQCGECRQKFDSEKAKQLHWRFIHDPNRHQED